MLAKSKYRIRHDIEGKYIHWLLLKKYRVPGRNKWYNHVSDVVTERDDGKVTNYWDKPIIILKNKGEERTDRYLDLTAVVRRQLKVKTVIIPTVLGALGTVPAKLSGSPKKLEIEDLIRSFQTALLI